MNGYVAEVVEANYKASPEQDRAGRPYPRHYAYIKMPWLASAANPDPISPFPVPVFLNHYHKDRQDWVPLPVGTRVVVIPVHRSRVNPLGLAVIAYGPQNTDDAFGDLRETAEYHLWPGNAGVDRYVDKNTDPVFGPNEDVGRTHLDGRGYGWITRHPWPDDPNRDKKVSTAPGTIITEEKRLDNAVVKYEVVHTGLGVVYTLLLDGKNQTASLADDKGNSVTIDTGANSITVEAVDAVLIDSAKLGTYGATPIAKPVVTGSKDGNTALASLCTALASLGLITNSTT